jgi:hypothetical protein
MKRFFLTALSVVLLAMTSCAHHYDSVLHKIGNSGYMISWARQAGAPKLAPGFYGEAVKLQKDAQKAFQDRAMTKASVLAQQAYDNAKQARDQALAATGKKF